MRSRMVVIILACAALTASFAAQAQAPTGNIAKGKIESQTCLGCHGIKDYQNIYPTYNVPKLAGQSAAYIVHALEEYKNSNRAFKTMHAQASTLTKQEMENIAAYFQSLAKPFKPNSGSKS